MGEGPIPFSAINRYARRYRINDIDAFDHFLEIVRAMDDEYRKILDEKRRSVATMQEKFNTEPSTVKQGAPKTLR